MIKYLLICGFVSIVASPALAVPWIQFDDIPVTAKDEVPGSSDTWFYAPKNRKATGVACFFRGAPQPAWRDDALCKHSTQGFGKYHNYGYLEIDDTKAVKGHSLKYRITGGANPSHPDGVGTHLHNKQIYLDVLANGNDPIADVDERVGTSHIFFSSYKNKQMDIGNGANRLSFYVHVPKELSVFKQDDGIPFETLSTFFYNRTLRIDSYPNWEGDPNSTINGHWYQTTPINGGGWIKVLVDAHPFRNTLQNGGESWPYPGSSYRTIPGTQYFDTIIKLGIQTFARSGLKIPPYSVWWDEIELYFDSEPQNTETISSPAILYVPVTKRFEVGLTPKYSRSNPWDSATYEVRYSFEQITNANWNDATPVVIQHDIPANYNTNISDPTGTPGRFRKAPKTKARNAWAPFKLQSSDEGNLTPGNTVYFAIKDVGQVGGDGMTPINGDPNAGRDYAAFPGAFDYEGDQPVLKLIHRIDYYIAEKADGIGELPSPTNVTITSSN